MTNIKHVNSIVDREFRNRINQLIDIVNGIGTSLNDLVVKGVMTTEQYTQLLTAINGLVKTGEINLDTLSEELKNEIEQINNKVDKGNVSVADINKNLGKIDQTFLSDELLEQIAGTTPINAVPADKSITTNKLADKSVTANKTDFIKVSNNLLDPSKCLMNKSLDVSGNVIDSTGYFLSELIPFDSTKKISLSQGTYLINLYKEDKSFISRTGITASNILDLSNVPNLGYFRLSRNTDPNTVMVNHGAVLQDFEPFYQILKTEHLPQISLSNVKDFNVTPDDEIHFVKSNNIFNKHTAQIGKEFDVNGNIVDSPDWVISENILVEGDKVAFTTNAGVRWIVYDKAGNVLSRSGKNNGSDILLHLDSTPNAYSFIICVHKSLYENFMANYGTHVLPYEDYGYTLVSTDKYPIRISSDIVPESAGGGTGSPVPGYVVNLTNTRQISEIYSDTYSTNYTAKLYERASKVSLDYIEVTSNSDKVELIIEYKDYNDQFVTEKVINPEDNTELPLTIGNIVKYGHPNVEYLIYDPVRSQFKIAIKHLNFSNGVSISVKNNHTSSINATTRVVGRYYV